VVGSSGGREEVDSSCSWVDMLRFSELRTLKRLREYAVDVFPSKDELLVWGDGGAIYIRAL
jgi:hypothetical protein